MEVLRTCACILVYKHIYTLVVQPRLFKKHSYALTEVSRFTNSLSQCNLHLVINYWTANYGIGGYSCAVTAPGRYSGSFPVSTYYTPNLLIVSRYVNLQLSEFSLLFSDFSKWKASLYASGASLPQFSKHKFN